MNIKTLILQDGAEIELKIAGEHSYVGRREEKSRSRLMEATPFIN